jgi:hypothetical protein
VNSDFVKPIAQLLDLALRIPTLEKKDAAKSKIGAAKSKRNPQNYFAHRQVPSHLQRAFSNEKPEIHTYVMFCI